MGYTYKNGDDLERIALDNDTTVEAILKANGITDISSIGDGQSLIIPGVDPGYTAQGTRIPTDVQAKASYAPDAPWASYDEAIEFYKKYGDGKTPVSAPATSGGAAVKPVASVGSPTAKDDTTWKIYEQSRRKLAQDSAEHVLGVYSQNTGGRANSYAVTAAANASNEILSTLPQEKLNWEAQQQSMKAATFNQQLAVAKQKADFGSYGELASLLGLSEEQVAANYGSVGNDVMTQILETMIKEGDYEAALRFAGIDYDPSIFAGTDPSSPAGAGASPQGEAGEFTDIFAEYPDGNVPQNVYDELVSKHGKGAVDGAGIKVGKRALTSQELGYIYADYPDGFVGNIGDWTELANTYTFDSLRKNKVYPSFSAALIYLSGHGIKPATYEALLNSNGWRIAKEDPSKMERYYSEYPALRGYVEQSDTYGDYIINFIEAAMAEKI